MKKKNSKELKAVKDFKERLSNKVYRAIEELDREIEQNGNYTNDEIEIEREMHEIFLKMIKKTKNIL